LHIVALFLGVYWTNDTVSFVPLAIPRSLFLRSVQCCIDRFLIHCFGIIAFTFLLRTLTKLCRWRRTLYFAFYFSTGICIFMFSRGMRQNRRILSNFVVFVFFCVLAICSCEKVRVFTRLFFAAFLATFWKFAVLLTSEIPKLFFSFTHFHNQSVEIKSYL